MLHKNSGLLLKICNILLGALIYAIAVNALLIPHHMLSGGVTGISILLYYLFKTPVGMLVFLINIPIFLIGYTKISKQFILLSLIGTAAASLFLLLTKSFVLPVENPILAAVFGGALVGAGTGLVFRQRGSLGGTDIISVMVHKSFSFSIGFITMSINLIIIGLAALIFNVELSLLTLLAMYISSLAMDAVQDGFNHRKTVIIISDHWEEIGPRLLHDIKRGVTYLHGEGAYTGTERKLIYCIVKTIELAKLKEVVREMDPNAFISVSDAREVMGRGFGIMDNF